MFGTIQRHSVNAMTVLKYEKEIVALLVIDPYNDFIYDVEMRAALDVNIPNYASAIVTTNEVVDSISSLSLSTKQ